MSGDTVVGSSNGTTKEPWVEPTVPFLCAEDIANIQPRLISGGGGYGGGGSSGGGGGSGGGTTTGTESHPVILSPGVPAPAASATKRWYQCSTTGAVDVSASTSRTGQITVKKSGLVLGTYGTIDQRSGQTLNETYVDYGLKTYKVGITSSSTSTLNCRISQHEDICPTPVSSQDTVLWTHTDGGDMNGLSGVVTYHRYVWYTTAEGVSGLVDVISFDDYLTYVNNILNGSWDASVAAASFIATSQSPPPFSGYVAAVGLVFTAVSVMATVIGMGSIDFTQDKIDEIRMCGDVYYDGSNPRYHNGVKMSMFTESGAGSTGVETFDVESWYGGQMVGAKGEVGTWS